jgi:hypothetical protein
MGSGIRCAVSTRTSKSGIAELEKGLPRVMIFR